MTKNEYNNSENQKEP